MTDKAVAIKEDAAVARIEPSTLLQVIQNAASNPDVDIDKMERLMAMHERLIEQQNRAAFSSAMNAAQKEIGRVAADSQNKQTHSEYASYAALDRVLRPIYTKHGLSLSFGTGQDAPPEYVRVQCNVSHVAGHSERYSIDMPADGKGAKGGDVMTKTHAVGSAAQYGMRYLLKLIFNVAIGEDDDGNAASLEPVSGEQSANIYALMDEVGADKQAFLKWAGVESVEMLPAKSYGFYVRALEKKRSE